MCVRGGGDSPGWFGHLKDSMSRPLDRREMGGVVDKSYLGNATIDRAFHTYSLKISKFPGQCNQTKRKFCP